MLPCLQWPRPVLLVIGLGNLENSNLNKSLQNAKKILPKSPSIFLPLVCYKTSKKFTDFLTVFQNNVTFFHNFEFKVILLA